MFEQASIVDDVSDLLSGYSLSTALVFAFLMFLCFINVSEAQAASPTITTGSLSHIASTTADIGGHIIFNGGATITDEGVCWSTSINPTTSDSCSPSTLACISGTFDIMANDVSPQTTCDGYTGCYANSGRCCDQGSCPDDAISMNGNFVPSGSIWIGEGKIYGSAVCPGPGNVIYDYYTTSYLCPNPDGHFPNYKNIPCDDNHNCTIPIAQGGTFYRAITGLALGPIYHVRAYATNSSGTGYGNDVLFIAHCAVALVGVVPSGYSTTAVQDAVSNAVISDSVIKTNINAYNENVVFSNDVPVTLQGGYDCSLGSIVGYTEIDGQVTFQGIAAVSIENIIIGE